MALKIPTASRVNFTNSLRADWNGATPLNIHLYKASHTPANADVLATYTAIEADFGGYAVLPIADWIDGGLDASSRAIALATGLLWTRTSGSNDIYGYFVTDDTDTVLWWAEALAGGPFTIDGTNPFLFVIPRFTFTTEF